MISATSLLGGLYDWRPLCCAVRGWSRGCGRYLGHRLWEVVQHLLGAGMQ